MTLWTVQREDRLYHFPGSKAYKGKNTGHIDLKDIDYELHILVFVCAFTCLCKPFFYWVKGGYIAYNVIIRAIESFQ